MKVIFIIGLPGSGKTHLAKELLNTIRDAWLIDDFAVHMLRQQPALIGVETIIVTDPTACAASPEMIRATLEKWLGKSIDLTFVAFDNDPEQCIINTNGRDDRVISPRYIRALSGSYDPARYSEDIRPVWHGD